MSFSPSSSSGCFWTSALTVKLAQRNQEEEGKCWNKERHKRPEETWSFDLNSIWFWQFWLSLYLRGSEKVIGWFCTEKEPWWRAMLEAPFWGQNLRQQWTVGPVLFFLTVKCNLTDIEMHAVGRTASKSPLPKSRAQTIYQQADVIGQY